MNCRSTRSRSFSVCVRKAAKKFLFAHPRFVFTKDITNSALSLLSCVSFVWGSYLEDDPSALAATRLAALDLFEFGACIIFALDYFLQMILAPNKLTHVMSGTALMDCITTFPQLLMFIILQLELSSKEVEYTAKLNFLRFIRVLKILRLERINRNVIENEETFARTIVSASVTKLVLTVITIVFCFSGVFSAVESTFGDPVKLAQSKQGNLDFLNCVYFILSTMSTVGFGDIVPVSVGGKLVFIVLIFVTFIVVARQLDQLTSLLKSQSKYSRESYNQLSKHVIVCGDIDHDTLRVFLEEFFHKDHHADIRVVVLVNMDPDWEMQRLLDNSAFSRVKYLRGSPNQRSDLFRCKLSKASCIFILNDPTSKNAADSDNQCILRALSVYASFEQGSNQLVILQLHSMLSKRRYLSIASPTQNVHIICWEELRPPILSACCENPCFGVILFNWIKSFSYSDSPFLKQQFLQGWQFEYMSGKGFEIYTAALSGYAHSSFHTVSAFLFMRFGVIMIAIEKSNNDTTLAPLGFVFGDFPTNVYLLAEDASIVNKLQKVQPNLDDYWRSFEDNFIGDDEAARTERASRESQVAGGGTGSNLNSVFRSMVKKTVVVAKAAKGFADIFSSNSLVLPSRVAPKVVLSRNWTILRRAVTVGAVLKAGLKSSTRMSKEQYAFLLESELNPKYNRLSSQLYFHVCADQNSAVVNLGANGRFEGHGHIIYCCRQVVGMRRFLAPLRSKHLVHVVPVVILCSSVSAKELANVALFPSVFVIVGSVLDSVNLLRASVATARVAVICMSQTASTSQETADNTMDADVIFAYNLIKRLNPNCALVSEFGLLENLKYLKEQPKLKNARDFGDLFASGTVFPHAFFTTLTCQCFFNPILPQLIIELLRPSPIVSLKSSEHPSVLVTFPSPSQFWGKSIAEAYPKLCQNGIILLGIIRAPNKRLGNVLPFAYSCPSSISIINEGDALQTLSSHNHDVILQKLDAERAKSSNKAESATSDSFLSHDSEKLLVDLVAKLADEVKRIRGLIHD